MSNGALIESMAATAGMNAREFESTVRDTCGCKGATPEQFGAFLLVAREYGLNPLVKEIFAFPSKGGGITPIVSVDGWLRMANDHEQFDGLTFEDRIDSNGNLLAITARLHRKDRAHAIEVTEYMAECRQNTDPWKKWPGRMLRHKAAIQAIRYGLGFSGIADPDEGERMLPVAAPSPARAAVEMRPKFEPKAIERRPATVEPVDTVDVATDEEVIQARKAIQEAGSHERLHTFRTVIAEREMAGFYSAAQARELLGLLSNRLDILDSNQAE